MVQLSKRGWNIYAVLTKSLKKLLKQKLPKQAKKRLELRMGSSQENEMAAENEEDAVENDEKNVADVAADEVEEENADSVETDEAEIDGAEAEPTVDETIALLEQRVEEAEAKAAENFDLLQRKAAEFQNSKRRQEKMVSEQIERASSKVVTKLLPVLDDFDLAFRNLPEGFSVEEDAWIGGFQQIQKKLMTLLSDEEVTTIPLEGAFDPTYHEAVSSEPNDDVESGHIIETLRMGYEHKGRILRPALVRVAM